MDGSRKGGRCVRYRVKGYISRVILDKMVEYTGNVLGGKFVLFVA